jgi:hypothetical protein
LITARSIFWQSTLKISQPKQGKCVFQIKRIYANERKSEQNLSLGFPLPAIAKPVIYASFNTCPGMKNEVALACISSR